MKRDLKSIKIATIDLGWRKAAKLYSSDFEAIKEIIQFLIDSEMEDQAFTVAKQYLSPVLFSEFDSKGIFKNCKIAQEVDFSKKGGAESYSKPETYAGKLPLHRDSPKSDISNTTQKKSGQNSKSKNSSLKNNKEPTQKKKRPSALSSKNKTGSTSDNNTAQYVLSGLEIDYARDLFFVKNPEKNFDYMIDHFQGAHVMSFSLKTYDNKISFILLATNDTVAIFDCNNLSHEKRFTEFLIEIFTRNSCIKITNNHKHNLELLSMLLKVEKSKFNNIIDICSITVRNWPMRENDYKSNYPEAKLKLIMKECLSLDSDLVNEFPTILNSHTIDPISFDFAILEVYLFFKAYIHFEQFPNELYFPINPVKLRTNHGKLRDSTYYHKNPNYKGKKENLRTRNYSKQQNFSYHENKSNSIDNQSENSRNNKYKNKNSGNRQGEYYVKLNQSVDEGNKNNYKQDRESQDYDDWSQSWGSEDNMNSKKSSNFAKKRPGIHKSSNFFLN